MAQLLQPFDAHQHDPSQSAGQLPLGKHHVIIETSEVKANSANTGGFLELGLRVIDGPAQGASGAYRLNLYNASAKAVEIAHRQLSAICHCIGVFNVSDSSQLHNIPFVVEVGLQNDEENKAKGYTEVKRVFDRNGNEPGKAGQGQPAAQPMQQQAPVPVQQAQQSAPAWGGAQQAPAQAPAPAQAQPAWGGQQPTQAPAAPAQAQPAWGQQAQPQGQPAWGAPR